jgi:hypothetical protein
MKKETIAQIYRDTFAACGGDVTADDLVSGGKRCPSQEEVIFAFIKARRRMESIGKTAEMTFGNIPGRVWLRIGRYKVGSDEIFSKRSSAYEFIQLVKAAEEQEEILTLNPASADFRRKLAEIYLQKVAR